MWMGPSCDTVYVNGTCWNCASRSLSCLRICFCHSIDLPTCHSPSVTPLCFAVSPCLPLSLSVTPFFSPPPRFTLSLTSDIDECTYMYQCPHKNAFTGPASGYTGRAFARGCCECCQWHESRRCRRPFDKGIFICASVQVQTYKMRENVLGWAAHCQSGWTHGMVLGVNVIFGAPKYISR